MLGTLSLVTAATYEPISLDAARAHLKVTHSDEDAQITRWISAARSWCEGFTGRQLCGATWDLSLDVFPGEGMSLPLAPLRSVTSVSYVDTSGVTQTLSSAYYTVKTFSGPRARPGRFSLAYNYAWPASRSVRDAVTIRFVAGYSATDATAAVARAAVPEELVQAMLLYIAEMDLQRRSSIVGTIVSEAPLSARNLASPFRVFPEGAW